MKKYFLLFIIIYLIIIQCSNKTDNNTNDFNTAVQSNETIPATKILSKEDEVFLEKIKNKIIISGVHKYIFKDNGDIEYEYDSGSYKKSYIFESSKDGTNAYYYSTYNLQEMYQKASSNIATNYEGFSVKKGILYMDNYEGYDMDPNETIRRKWERENYYSNYYYKTVKENPNFDNFPYENKADVTFNEYNEEMIGILISEDDYKPEEVGDIENYDFDGTYDKSAKEKVYYNAVKWYAKNYDEINESFNKIIYYDFEGGGYDKFNMENAYLYMSKFENTGYFSENYIKNLEYKFKDIKKNLEENKQNDEFIEGMEYDWFLRTQEMDYILDMIDIMQLKDIQSYTDDGKEYCQYYGLSLQVKKYGDEWLIEK